MIKKNEIKKITLWGLWVNVFLSIIKFIIGFLGNSQAVIADAVHSLSDTSSDFLILFGVKYWTAPPDSEHPYGHQKIESFVTILIGLILFSAACGIGFHAIVTINEIHAEKITIYTLIAPVISILFKEILFRKTYQVGVDINSTSVKANAWHHRTDALSSVPVLIAVTASLINPKFLFLDHIGALIVAAFILRLSFKIIFDNVNELIDTGISDEELQNISEMIKTNFDVKGCHKIRTRKIGSSIYVDLHLEVDGGLTVLKGHMISEQVKSDLIRENTNIIDVMIHLEPEE